jgi:uncharacterized protein YbaR (Trm112 family)
MRLRRANLPIRRPIPMSPSNKLSSTATDSSGPCALDLSVLSQLACPACLGGLSLDDRKLVCGECGRAYPIVDGIPVLIAGRAENHAH